MLVHLQPDKFARLDLLWVNMFIIVHQTTHVDDGYWPSRPLPAFTTVTGRYDRYRPLLAEGVWGYASAGDREVAPGVWGYA